MALRRTAVAVLALLLAGATASCSDDATEAGATTTTTVATTTTVGLPAGAEAVGLRELDVGQCFEQPRDDPGAEDRAVWLVGCADPHTHEVYAVVTYEGDTVKGGGYPGTTVVQDWAEQTCYAQFEGFVGRAWTTSSFDIETWWPSEESWGRSDRKVICTVYPSSGGRTTGSARGSDA
ncbi:septum formation family protein [Dermatobacter hominis]|uniref:septum formation family protein n=1 Tax=Dermatobacter hominis TaxID=2884263 RepID=UPI001D1110F4|nr:septum formation family protein [Dermatobacter hominis]UDY37290.1 septum formation family protein [Dermatobacter hominis]